MPVWRLEPSKATRLTVSTIAGLEKRRSIRSTYCSGVMPGTGWTWGTISSISTLSEQRPDPGMRHGGGDGLDAEDLGRIDDHLVTRIEDADLHLLVVLDAVGEGRADLVPVRPAGAEIVLDHPLAEVLMGDRGGIVDAERRAPARSPWGRWPARCSRPSNWGSCSCCVDPVGQRRIGKPRQRGHGLMQDVAVALEVVAGLAGEGADAAVAPKLQRRDDGAEGGARPCRDAARRAGYRDAPASNRLLTGSM